MQALINLFFVSAILTAIILFYQPDLLRKVSVPASGENFVGTTENQKCTNAEEITTTKDRLDQQLSAAIEEINVRIFNLEINNNPVNIAVSSVDQLYLKSKALEFCSENYAFLGLSDRLQILTCSQGIANHILKEIEDLPESGFWLKNLIPMKQTVPEVVNENNDSN